MLSPKITHSCKSVKYSLKLFYPQNQLYSTLLTPTLSCNRHYSLTNLPGILGNKVSRTNAISDIHDCRLFTTDYALFYLIFYVQQQLILRLNIE